MVHGHLIAWCVNLSIKVPIVATLHGYKNYGRLSKGRSNDIFYGQLVYYLARFFVREITCVSDHLKDIALNDNWRKVTTIYNPIDSNYKHNCKPYYGSFKKDKIIKLVTCALISKRKGIHHILETINVLNGRGYDVKFNIIGPFVDSEYELYVKKKVSELNLTSVVYYLGALEPEKIQDVYSSSNVGVFLSEMETFGLAPIEMYMSGLPVITSKTGVISDFIKSGIDFDNLKYVDYWDYEKAATLIMDVLIEESDSENSRDAMKKMSTLR